MLKVIYPILWWGIIALLDAINFRQRNKSLIRSHLGEFFGILVPVSVLYWLYFELVNFSYPQWHYLGILPDLFSRTLMAFISFATVIPIVIEIAWFIGGPIAAETFLKPASFRSYDLVSILAGLILAITPFFSDNFILNQGIWIAPFLIFLPVLKLENFTKRFILTLIFSGLISGLLWEFLNFWAEGKWQYLILPKAVRIFEMPLLGYLGFIPFAFSTFAVYLAVYKFIKPRPANIIVLYSAAIIASVLFASSVV